MNTAKLFVAALYICLNFSSYAQPSDVNLEETYNLAVLEIKKLEAAAQYSGDDEIVRNRLNLPAPMKDFESWLKDYKSNNHAGQFKENKLDEDKSLFSDNANYNKNNETSEGREKISNPKEVVDNDKFYKTGSGEMNDSRIIKILIYIAIISFIVLLLLGMTNRVVIFYDWNDFYMTLAIFLASLVGFTGSIVIFADDPLLRNITGSLTAMVTLFLCFKSVHSAIKYNKNILIGLLIGVMKIFISIFSAFILVSKIGVLLNEKTTLSQRFSAMLFVLAIIWFTKSLVNGEKVYCRKGWVE